MHAPGALVRAPAPVLPCLLLRACYSGFRCLLRELQHFEKLLDLPVRELRCAAPQSRESQQRSLRGGLCATARCPRLSSATRRQRGWRTASDTSGGLRSAKAAAARQRRRCTIAMMAMAPTTRIAPEASAGGARVRPAASAREALGCCGAKQRCSAGRTRSQQGFDVALRDLPDPVAQLGERAADQQIPCTHVQTDERARMPCIDRAHIYRPVDAQRSGHS